MILPKTKDHFLSVNEKYSVDVQQNFDTLNTSRLSAYPIIVLDLFMV